MRPSFRPKLEPLEGRDVPSTLTHSQVHMLINRDQLRAAQVQAEITLDRRELVVLQPAGGQSPRTGPAAAHLRADISADRVALQKLGRLVGLLSRLDAVQDTELMLGPAANPKEVRALQRRDAALQHQVAAFM
jgi:hypothetical protein